MYVLLYVNQDNQPCYIQGSMEHINAAFRNIWIDGDVDREEWGYQEPWQLLGIEDGRLTPMYNVTGIIAPHFEVA
jgi:hypothetical protein